MQASLKCGFQSDGYNGSVSHAFGPSAFPPSKDARRGQSWKFKQLVNSSAYSGACFNVQGGKHG